MTGASNQELATGTVRGDHHIHLFLGAETQALCSQTRSTTEAVASFRSAPCDACLSVALGAGHVIARERGNAFINLRRIGVRV